MLYKAIEVVGFNEVDFTLDRYWRVRFTKEDMVDVAKKRRYPNNRRLKRAKELYARDMRNGNWMNGNGETLKFNLDGQLIDGQNRIAAAILSGLDEIVFDVKTGIDNSVMPTIDNGVVRSDADILTFNEFPNAMTVAAIARAVQTLHNGATCLGSHTGINIAPTRTEVLEFSLLNKDTLIEKATNARRTCEQLNVKGFGPRGWFIVWWLTDCKDPDAAMEFLERTKTQKGSFAKMLTSMREVGPDGKARSIDWIVAQYLDYFNEYIGGEYVVGNTSEEILKGYKKLLTDYIENARVNDKHFKYLK